MFPRDIGVAHDTQAITADKCRKYMGVGLGNDRGYAYIKRLRYFAEHVKVLCRLDKKTFTSTKVFAKETLWHIWEAVHLLLVPIYTLKSSGTHTLGNTNGGQYYDINVHAARVGGRLEGSSTVVRAPKGFHVVDLVFLLALGKPFTPLGVWRLC